MKNMNNSFRNIVKTFFVGAFIMTCTTCEGRKTKEIPYFPNDIGDTWTYVRLDSNYYDYKCPGTDTIIISVTDTFRDKNRGYLFTHWRIQDPKYQSLTPDPLYPKEPFLYKNIIEHNDTVDFTFQDYDNTHWRYLIPFHIGQRWTLPSWTFTVVKKDTVTVPAGTFTDCFLLSVIHSPSAIEDHVWFVPGVGEVQRTSKSLKEPRFISWKLQNYNIVQREIIK